MSYLPQFVQNLQRNSDSILPENARIGNGGPPRIRYLAVFNAKLADQLGERNADLIKQIACFETDSEHKDMDMDEKLNVIGFCSGIEAFALGFSSKSDKSLNENIIRTDGSTILVKELEKDYHLVCCIGSLDDRDSGMIGKQLLASLSTAYDYYRMLNKSMTEVLSEYDIEVLQTSLSEFWGGYLRDYNESADRCIHTPFKWVNDTANYRGVLGLFPLAFKKSSLLLNFNCRNEFDLILSELYPLKPPAALMVANFDESIPKTYGVIHVGSNGEIANQSLRTVYNWLELHERSNKLGGTHLASPGNGELFKRVEVPQEVLLQAATAAASASASPSTSTSHARGPDDLTSVRSFRTTAQSTLDILNPVNLTNNLVILPLNYTMNGMMNMGGNANRWLGGPSYLLFGQGNSSASQDSTSHSQNDTDDEGGADDHTGTYLVGLVANSLGDTIHRKLVYLEQLDSGKLQEYLLVIYTKGNLVVVLVYDSALEELDQPSFYEALQETILEPAINEIITSLMVGVSEGMTGNSINSLKSLNGIIEDGSTAQDFFFIIYDPEEGSIKTSLPYLPLAYPSVATTTMAVKLNNLIYYLHDSLSDLFIVQENPEFFQNNKTMKEYFHKFNAGRSTDWMFYYIQYHGKYIIVIKNHSSNRKTSGGGTSRKPSLAVNLTPSSPTGTTNNNNANGFLDGIYDYAHLGFLENLGDDVKVWLEGFSINGET